MNFSEIILSNVSTTLSYSVIEESVEKGPGFVLAKKILYSGFIPVIVLCGLVMNFLSIAVLYSKNELTSTTIYLINLAVADILVLLNVVVNCTFVTMDIFNHPKFLEWNMRSLPYFHAFFNSVPGRLGNLITAAVSIERFMAIVMSLQIRRFPRKKIAAITILFFYVYVFALSVPFVFVYELKTVNTNVSGMLTAREVLTMTDFARSINFNLMYIIVETCLRFIPVLLVLVFSFLSIAALLWNKHMLTSGNSQRSLRESRELRVTKTILTLTCTFLVCQLPNTVMRLLILLDSDNDFYSLKSLSYAVTQLVSYILFIVNSCVNFLIYVGTSARYREKIRTMCLQLFCRRSSTLKPTSTLSIVTSTTSLSS